MGYVFQPQHNKQAIHGPGIFSYCVVREHRENWREQKNECKTQQLQHFLQKDAAFPAAHLQALSCFVSAAFYIQAETNNFMKLLVLR